MEKRGERKEIQEEREEEGGERGEERHVGGERDGG